MNLKNTLFLGLFLALGALMPLAAMVEKNQNHENDSFDKDFDEFIELYHQETNKTYYDQNKCCICQEEFEIYDQNLNLACNHKYHHDCILDYALQGDNSNKCPLCKKNYTLDTILTINQLKKLSQDQIDILQSKNIFLQDWQSKDFTNSPELMCEKMKNMLNEHELSMIPIYEQQNIITRYKNLLMKTTDILPYEKAKDLELDLLHQNVARYIVSSINGFIDCVYVLLFLDKYCSKKHLLEDLIPTSSALFLVSLKLLKHIFPTFQMTPDEIAYRDFLIKGTSDWKNAQQDPNYLYSTKPWVFGHIAFPLLVGYRIIIKYK